jgi:hypothetical protein
VTTKPRFAFQEELLAAHFGGVAGERQDRGVADEFGQRVARFLDVVERCQAGHRTHGVAAG